jgi:hypothetical protein
MVGFEIADVVFVHAWVRNMNFEGIAVERM